MNENLKKFLIKFVVFAALLFLVRSLFQVPVEYFRLKMFYELESNRVFSKGDAIKVIVLAGALFLLGFRERISKLKHPKLELVKSSLYLLGALISVAAYYGLRYLTNYFLIREGIGLFAIIALKFLALASAGLLLLLCAFQIRYAQDFFRDFKKELAITSALSVLFYFILMFFQAQWRFFSDTVLNNLIFMFSKFYNVTNVYNPSGNILTVKGFSVAIGAPCSGIDSLLLFFAFFLVIFALDFKRIKKIPYLILFVIGMFGVFLVNNLRIFLLVLAGIKISPKFAVGLFHTNAGWLLFIIYFILYYYIIKRFIYKKEEIATKKN